MNKVNTYRAKPVMVEAVEIVDDSSLYPLEETGLWQHSVLGEFYCSFGYPKTGDFIIRQSLDNNYLCPRKEFLEKYELIENVSVEKSN